MYVHPKGINNLPPPVSYKMKPWSPILTKCDPICKIPTT